MIPFDNSYARLPATLFTRQDPVPVAAPKLLAFNHALADSLGIPAALRTAEVFSGNVIPEGAAPLAQLYAGHQFGQWNPQLGDGRAILLGEVVDASGHRRDIQLKGAGRTPYSRGGDGRAWLGPVLREYLLSEAMHAMGLPTTRALAAVATGETVYRETPLPGGIVTRVAASHIRVGTFQILAARGMTEELAALCDHTRARHYPEAKTPEDLLAGVVARSAELVAGWMGIGFIHGVMNTDNMALSGETIDYGPAAFIDGFHPDRVFSAIDRLGRYAWSNQPGIAAWNMAQLATALLPLEADRDAAIARYTEIVHGFADLYEDAYNRVFAAKLGLAEAGEAQQALANDLLRLMAEGETDFTTTFADLGRTTLASRFADAAGFDHWQARWEEMRAPDWADRMAQANPQVIPRNHLVEEAIAAAVADDLAPFEQLLAAVTTPRQPPDDPRLAAPPAPGEAVTRTFCGT